MDAIKDRLDRAKSLGWQFGYDYRTMPGHPLFYGKKPDGTIVGMPTIGWTARTAEEMAAVLDERGIPA